MKNEIPTNILRCNICGNTKFIDFNGRIKVQCAECKSLERHRLIRWVLEALGYLNSKNIIEGKRALHLAPEEMTHRYLVSAFGGGYICADLEPSKYPHAQCLRLALPEGFTIFSNSYFDLILHNHVMEHIPGDYKDHLNSFFNLLRPSGHMIFTLPGISQKAATIQGGELLSTDAERIRLHGQSDHYKSFGYDFIEFFMNLPGTFGPIEIPLDVRITIGALSDPVYVYKKY